MSGYEPCPVAGCDGDARYAPPGRGHREGCDYLGTGVNEESQRAIHTERAFFVDKPCALAKYHAPVPVITEGHHVRPIFLQNRLYGRIRDNTLKYLCGNCHDAVHAWLYWLLGERKEPPRIGDNAKAEAQWTYVWYMSEKERLGR